MSLCVKQSQCGADWLESSAFGNDIMALEHWGKERVESLGQGEAKGWLP